MAVRPVLTYPDERLKRIAAPVEAFDAALRAAVADLEATGSTRKDAIAEVARLAGVPKRDVYHLIHAT